MRKICVIPARMASSRLPGKPLILIHGVPLIQHVYLRCSLFSGFERIIVATCDKEIADCITALGGEVVMTSANHDRATDRVEEAVEIMNLALNDDDLVLMVQGDEILVSPYFISEIVTKFEKDRPAVVNLVSQLYTEEDFYSSNCVKVAISSDDRVLYFSRSPIPSRCFISTAPIYQQTGIIAFRANFLPIFSALPQSPLEKIESCDMLRALENSIDIVAVRTNTETIGIDTEEDCHRADKMLHSDPLIWHYLKKN